MGGSGGEFLPGDRHGYSRAVEIHGCIDVLGVCLVCCVSVVCCFDSANAF